MKVVIDGRCITPKVSGISRYTFELIKGYQERFGVDNVIVIVHSCVRDESFKKVYTNLQKHRIGDCLKFRRFLSTLDFDIYHAADLIGAFLKVKNKFYVTTVHDLMYLQVKSFFNGGRFYNFYAKNKLKFLHHFFLKRSDWLISVSETTRKDVLNHFNRQSTVFREGINIIASSGDSDVVQDLESDTFFLYVGLTAPHKNVPFLINAFLKTNTKKKLIICGRNTGNIACVDSRVIFTGWVNDSQLQFLYSNCSAFVFPSLYEGFGLPVLEALSLGVKVISSNAGSLSEFSSEFVSFFDPKDEKSLIDKLENVDNISYNPDKLRVYLEHYNWENIMQEFQNELVLQYSNWLANGK